eukprot:1051265-Rhodomonas_salina.3
MQWCLTSDRDEHFRALQLPNLVCDSQHLATDDLALLFPVFRLLVRVLPVPVFLLLVRVFPQQREMLDLVVGADTSDKFTPGVPIVCSSVVSAVSEFPGCLTLNERVRDSRFRGSR